MMQRCHLLAPATMHDLRLLVIGHLKYSSTLAASPAVASALKFAMASRRLNIECSNNSDNQALASTNALLGVSFALRNHWRIDSEPVTELFLEPTGNRLQ